MENRGAVQMDRSAQAANISVGVMLRAANTAVQALMAEISPWMLSLNEYVGKKVGRQRRYVGSPVRKFAPRHTISSLVWFTIMEP
jgi:hypothetical protein